MILSRDEFFNRVSEFVGDRSDDTAINFIEDMSETFDDMERRIADGGEADYKRQLEENDRVWRERYKARFFNGKSSGYKRVETTEIDDSGNMKENITIDELFN